jgi:hypothetical protein
MEVKSDLLVKGNVSAYGLLVRDPWVDPRIYGTVGTQAALISSLAAISTNKRTLYIPPGNWSITSNITFPSNVMVKMEHGSTLTLSPGVSAAFNGGIDAGLYHIFNYGSGSGVSFGNGKINYVYPQWWGAAADGVTDDTLSCQYALNTGKNVFIPGGTYLINVRRVVGAGYAYGLTAFDNQHIRVAANATLKAKPVSELNYAILAIFEKSHVIVEGGKWIGERYENTAAPSIQGWGYGIDCRGSQIVTIKDNIFMDFHGDGIYFGKGSTTTHSGAVTVHNVFCSNNRRQGMSPCYVNNLKVSDSTFINTNGTSPGAGVDCEPDGADWQYGHTFTNCFFGSNEGCGLSVVRTHNAKAINCIFINNGGGDGSSYRGGGVEVISDAIEDISADLTLINCDFIDNVNWTFRTASNGAGRPTTITASLTVDNCRVSGTPDPWQHFLLNSTDAIDASGHYVNVTNSRFTVSGASCFFGWNPTHTDTTTNLRIENNDFIVDGPSTTDILNGGKVIYKGNRWFLKTGYTNANNAGQLITNTPFVNYQDCEYYNDTSYSCNVGVATALAKKQNSIFGENVVFQGLLSDNMVAGDNSNTHTSGTSKTTLYTYNVEADSMGIYGKLTIHASGSKIGTNGTKTLILAIGTNEYTFHTSNDENEWMLSATITAVGPFYRLDYMGGNISAPPIYGGAGTAAAHIQAVSFDWTVDQTIKIYGQCSNTNDLIYLDILIIEK